MQNEKKIVKRTKKTSYSLKARRKRSWQECFVIYVLETRCEVDVNLHSTQRLSKNDCQFFKIESVRERAGGEFLLGPAFSKPEPVEAVTEEGDSQRKEDVAEYNLINDALLEVLKKLGERHGITIVERSPRKYVNLMSCTINGQEIRLGDLQAIGEILCKGMTCYYEECKAFGQEPNTSGRRERVEQEIEKARQGKRFMIEMLEKSVGRFQL